MSIFFICLFWLSFLLCLSTYAVYPLVIWLVGFYSPFKIEKGNYTPFISVIIPAFNEEKHISGKIQNTLAVDYPADRIEILLGSDGSNDNTALIMKEYINDRIHFFDFPENRGKTAVQNDLVKKAKGDVLVFTDAASFISPASFRALTSNFNDMRVGCVAGCMRFVKIDTNLTTQSQGLYWRYELKIRDFESRVGSLIGVDGPLYAVKSECYDPLDCQMISDLLTPLLVLDKGGKVVFEPDAQVDEEPTTKTAQEFSTRRRITLRGLTGLWEHRYLLNPLENPFLAFQIIFHKIVRWAIGLLWGINIISCAVLSARPIFLSIFFLHILFLALAIMGWIISKKGRTYRLLIVPYYFCLVNLAAAMGIIDFLRKKQAVSWKPVR